MNLFLAYMNYFELHCTVIWTHEFLDMLSCFLVLIVAWSVLWFGLGEDTCRRILIVS